MIEDGLWKVAAVLLSVVLLFVVPMYLSYERQDEIIYHTVERATDQFSEKVREIGYVDRMLLEQLKSELNATGYTYDVALEHLEKRFSENNGLLEVYYEGTYTEDIAAVLAQGEQYRCHIGDFFYVKVRCTSRSNADVLRGLFGVHVNRSMLQLKSGGIIRYGDT